MYSLVSERFRMQSHPMQYISMFGSTAIPCNANIAHMCVFALQSITVQNAIPQCLSFGIAVSSNDASSGIRASHIIVNIITTSACVYTTNAHVSALSMISTHVQHECVHSDMLAYNILSTVKCTHMPNRTLQL